MATKRPHRHNLLALSTLAAGAITLSSIGIAGQHSAGVARSFGGGRANIGYGYSAPYYGGYGGVYVPTYGPSSYASTYSGLPPYWWAGPYANSNPGGPGTNPDSGYAWDSVSVLILETVPEKARVTLDGIFVGTNDCLGPTQLPMGDHTLRVDAPGYEPSITVLHVEKPVLQQLEVRLTATARAEITHSPKPAPK